MRRRRWTAPTVTAAMIVATVVALSGCTPQAQLVAGSKVVVAVTDPFTSANAETSYGRGSQTNLDVALLTSTGFGYTNDRGATVADRSFGSAQLLSRDPLTVKYTVNSGVEWSDGVPIDGTDLLLAWAANSGSLNTPKFDDSDYVDAQTGRYGRAFPKGIVYFDGSIGNGLEKANKLPVIGDNGRSLTVVFTSFVPDWSTLLVPTVPAHVLAETSLHSKAGDDSAGKKAVRHAIQNDNSAELHALAGEWNEAYNLAATPKDAKLLVSSGPYSISKITPTRVELTANPRYVGDRRPSFETMTMQISPDPLITAQLLASGEVDIATPEPRNATAQALSAIPGLTVTTGTEARAEHLDLQFSQGRNSTFDDPTLRKAFLLTVPRQQILQQLNSPSGPDGGEQGAKLLDSFVLRLGAPGYAEAIATNGSGDFASSDISAAKKLLTRADAVDPTVCILYDPSNAWRVTEFRLIQLSAARAGFKVTDCSSPDWQGLLGVAGAYDAALFGWDTTRLGLTAQARAFHSGAALANFSHFDNADADALIDQLTATDDGAKQTAVLTKLDAKIWADAYGVPLYAYPTLTAVDARVTGVTRSPLAASVFWNAWTWEPAAPSPAHVPSRAPSNTP